MLTGLLAHLAGPGLGIVGHLATEGAGWLRDRQRLKAAQEDARMNAAVAVDAASRREPVDWLHWSLTVILLVGATVAALIADDGNELFDAFRSWAGIAVGWSFGRLATR